jgi:hypothetical protein
LRFNEICEEKSFYINKFKNQNIYFAAKFFMALIPVITSATDAIN